jgi:5-hydroxyisourate hydrolase
MSQITTHVLDTSKGKAAWGVSVALYQKVGIDWIQYSKGITNKEGRITNLLAEDQKLPVGIYKLTFDTLHYFNTMDIECFFPVVEIIFEIKTAEHYHVPLLISPFGYSTYRGC